MRNINLLLIASFLLFSCGGIKDAGKVLRNEKVKSTDEFLVKKKDPLVLPPNFDEIPEPNSTTKNIDEKNKIKKILKTPKESKINQNKTSAIEGVILDKMKK
tara:strand:- start:925 stop:1230 length:306 start_codon:yes stop_codon:yes gene_type:complete